MAALNEWVYQTTNVKAGKRLEQFIMEIFFEMNSKDFDHRKSWYSFVIFQENDRS